jgi:dihydroorotate dehydrogenase
MSHFRSYEDGFMPFAPAAGAINGLSEEEIISKIIDVAKSPANAVKWGSITLNRNQGNSGRTYSHNSISGTTVNALGLPNIGYFAARKLQKQMQPQVEAEGKPLIPSFSPGKGEDPSDVLPQIAYGLAEAGVKLMEVNYSCQNKEAESGGYEPILGNDLDAMFEVDEKIVAAVGRDVELIRKLPPYFWYKYLSIAKVIDGFNEISQRPGGDVILGLFNSVGNQTVFDEKGQPALAVGESRQNLGSISGPKLAQMSINGLRRFKQALRPEVQVISSLGVDDANQIYERVDIEGADTTEGVTILWENEKQGKKFGQTITELAQKYHEICEQDT